MKLFFISVISIFVLFMSACIVGFFLPNTLTVERSVDMAAYPDDVFFYIDDLTKYRDWSALDAQLQSSELITGGADMGIGQRQAWQNGPKGFEFGSREIIQAQPGEFVIIQVNMSGQESTTTHALLSSEGERFVTVLSKIELPQPGFPFIGRLRGLMTKGQIGRDLERALERLKVQVEANAQE